MNSNDETTKVETPHHTTKEEQTETVTSEAPSCCSAKEHTETRLSPEKRAKKQTLLWKRTSGFLAVALVASLVFDFSFAPIKQSVTDVIPSTSVALASEVLPEEGVVLPISWGNLGIQMTESGVIDAEKFEKLYESRGGMQKDTLALLNGETAGEVRITPENAQELLNLLWAFGLGNKSPILENGMMTTYDGTTPPTREEALAKAGRMAATGGWPLSVGNPMDHYSMHPFVELTKEQWQLVERVASGIYRPCCNNPTHFPDCNHGMAMLGLIELMAASNVSEGDMYKVALAVNSYWFPDTYLTIAKYMGEQQTIWKDVDAQSVLGAAYSSGSGFGKIRAAVEPVQSSGGAGCSV